MNIINFIGCGRLGKTIAKLIKENNLGVICGILNSTYESGVNASKFIGQGESCRGINELPEANIYFITTRDDLIESVCNKLIREKKLKTGTVIVHCSGSLSSSILYEAQKAGCLTISVHPIKSFANPDISATTFPGTYCAYEGDQTALKIIQPIFEGIGGVLFQINKETKSLYHAAGVIANNYLVILHYVAFECYKSAGVKEDIAYNIASMLMRDALHNLQSSNHSQALTGPLQRGDTAVISKHLMSLESNPVLLDVYMAMGKAGLPLAKHSESIIDEFNDLFKKQTRSINTSQNKLKCKL